MNWNERKTRRVKQEKQWKTKINWRRAIINIWYVYECECVYIYACLCQKKSVLFFHKFVLFVFLFRYFLIFFHSLLILLLLLQHAVPYCYRSFCCYFWHEFDVYLLWYAIKAFIFTLRKEKIKIVSLFTNRKDFLIIKPLSYIRSNFKVYSLIL